MPSDPSRKQTSVSAGSLFGPRKRRNPLRRLHILRNVSGVREKEFCGMGSRFSEAMRHGFLLRAWNALLRLGASTPVAVYGTFFFTFGVSTLLFNLADYYIRSEVNVPLVTLIVGIAFALLSIPAFFDQDPISVAAQKHSLTDTVCFEVFCFRRLRAEDAMHNVRIFPAVLFGIAFGVAGWLLPFGAVLLVLFGCLFVMLSLSSPEFAFYTSLLALPLFPLLGDLGFPVTAALLALALLSFTLKVMLGKRIFHLSFYDLFLLFFAILFLVSALPVFGKNQLSPALKTVAVCFAYLPLANFILNRRIADSSVFLLVFSSTCASIYGIVRFLFEVVGGESALLSHPEWEGAFFFPGIAEAVGYHRVASTFASPELFAVLLAVTVVNIVIYLGEARKEEARGTEALLIASLVICGAAMILTFTPGVLLSLLLTMLACRVLRSRKIRNFVLLPLSLISTLPYLLPTSLYENIGSFPLFRVTGEPIVRLHTAFFAKIRAFSESPLFGCGLDLSENGADILFASLLANTGILVTVAFLILLIKRLDHLDRFARFLRSSSVRLPILASSATVFLFVTLGATVNFFADTSLAFLFWSAFGAGTATLRIAKSEADELRYLNLDAESDVAAADLLIRS